MNSKTLINNFFMDAFENQITSNANQAGSLYTVTKTAGQTIFYVETAITAASRTTTYQLYSNDLLGSWYTIVMHLKFESEYLHSQSKAKK